MVEMGARGDGPHRAPVRASPARPVGVVTNVGPGPRRRCSGRSRRSGGPRASFRAALPAGGTAVLNADDERVAAMKVSTPASVLTFGLGAGDVRADRRVARRRAAAVVPPAHAVGRRRRRPAGAWRAPGAERARGGRGGARARRGLDEVAAGLARGASSRRGAWSSSRRADGGSSSNDAYNANPQSTEAALRALAEIDAAAAHRGARAHARAGRRLGRASTGVSANSRARARHRGDRRRSSAPDDGGDDVADVEAALARLGAPRPGRRRAGEGQSRRRSRAPGRTRSSGPPRRPIARPCHPREGPVVALLIAASMGLLVTFVGTPVLIRALQRAGSASRSATTGPRATPPRRARRRWAV